MQISTKGLCDSMKEFNPLTKQIVDAAYNIHVRLGPGLLESVYERVLIYELHNRGFQVDSQRPMPIVYDDLKFDIGFRADLVVNDSIIVELKSVESVSAAHKKQLLTYLRLADLRVGLLINFGENLIKNGIYRIVNGY
jgi:GxxExxY protein